MKRLGSIDVFRALTMYLMVFVNDLWTDKSVPVWLEHAPAHADGMGFADIIFPAFLFIVGLSIPFGIEARIQRGQLKSLVFKHIFFRSLALVVMGFFQVNLESYSDLSWLPRSIWSIAVTASFFLIWLDYPKNKKSKKWWLQAVGVVTLIVMAILYRGHAENGTALMSPHWWGILGLIGWAYFSCATLLLLGGERLFFLTLCFVFFVFFNSSVMLDWSFMNPIRNFAGFFGLGNASNASITITGVIASVLYRRFRQNQSKLILILFLIAILLFIFGFGTRPLWGISKIKATPSWTTICAAISVLSFTVFIYLIDQKKKENWFRMIKPAGTSTLTCYLLPYFHEAIFLSLIGIRLPLFLRTGGIGIIKSLVFALLIVLLTGWLEKRKLRLKI